jgi:hypothetical protein
MSGSSSSQQQTGSYFVSCAIFFCLLAIAAIFHPFILRRNHLLFIKEGVKAA